MHCFDLYTIETKFSVVHNFLLKGNFSFESLLGNFQERVWITSMRRVISLSTGVEVHVVYLRKSIIQPLFTGKPVVPKLPVYCNT